MSHRHTQDTSISCSRYTLNPDFHTRLRLNMDTEWIRFSFVFGVWSFLSLPTDSRGNQETSLIQYAKHRQSEKRTENDSTLSVSRTIDIVGQITQHAESR